jgi:acyl-CoA thioester hydrolase
MYSLDFKVRDYELDLQGIVNNSNYQKYLEHARHEFLLSQGVSFSDLHDDGNDLVVVRVEMDFKQALKSQDEFTVTVSPRLKGIKIAFDQEIIRKSDNKVVLKAVVYGVSVKNGRPSRPDEVFDIIMGKNAR